MSLAVSVPPICTATLLGMLAGAVFWVTLAAAIWWLWS